MRETDPTVHLICRPHVDLGALETYLHMVDGTSWLEMRERDGFLMQEHAELLVEVAGRLCYRSWKPGLNANVTKIREDRREYLGNMLKSAHGSVLEHANYTFIFHDVSRVFTHELVRHRVGVAISQESLRYVRLTDLGFRVPDILDPLRSQIISLVERLEDFQRSAAERFGLDDEGVPFHYKKEVTSALRRLAPIGLSTGMVWTANIRTMRHVLASRTAEGAEEEIRAVFDRVGLIMQKEAPNLFQDFTRSDKGVWIPEHPVAGQTRVASLEASTTA